MGIFPLNLSIISKDKPASLGFLGPGDITIPLYLFKSIANLGYKS